MLACSFFSCVKMDKLDIQRKKTSFEKLFQRIFICAFVAILKWVGRIFVLRLVLNKTVFFALQLVSKLNILINKGL